MTEFAYLTLIFRQICIFLHYLSTCEFFSTIFLQNQSIFYDSSTFCKRWTKFVIFYNFSLQFIYFTQYFDEINVFLQPVLKIKFPLQSFEENCIFLRSLNKHVFSCTLLTEIVFFSAISQQIFIFFLISSDPLKKFAFSLQFFWKKLLNLAQFVLGLLLYFIDYLPPPQWRN